ncbi:unnamed protein product [Ectocarpus sp. 12 AP-2014]
MDGFKKDVEEIMTRMRCEYDSAKDSAERELGEGRPDVEGNPRCQPLRVVLEEDLLALDLTSSNGQYIDLLQHRLEHLAYNGHDGCSFASVRSFVPEPYLPAIATLEAIRRARICVVWAGHEERWRKGFGRGTPRNVEASSDSRRPYRFLPNSKRNPCSLGFPTCFTEVMNHGAYFSPLSSHKRLTARFF